MARATSTRRPAQPRSRARRLFTIGYEGRSPEELVAALEAEGVRTLVDVRELPLSRKRGFSKSALAEVLARAGIVYEHIRALGSPKAIRDRMKATGDRERFLREFRRHLEGQGEALRRVGALARVSTVALLCLERDASRCHRRLVASRLAESESMEVVDL